jgi:ribosomal protection tetracycline resistance protein
LLRRTLNLGILAHVDAGKTTLTERLLFATGVIDEIGSVDEGTTQTDSLELERRRGITIKSAVVSFSIAGVLINLIDTPGHPDFIAEVERVLSILDGVVLVISAVEGVQPQTRVLMRALQRLRVPTLLFVNKIDRRGADPERVLEVISGRLTAAVVPMGGVDRSGGATASFTPWGGDDPDFQARLIEVLAGQNDSILSTYVENEAHITYALLRDELAAQTKQALVHPIFFGSAITGAGVEPLMAGLVELLPTSAGNADGPMSGSAFKIERGTTGEKIAYVRMFSGTVRTRDRLRVASAFRDVGGEDVDEKVTAISVFDAGSWRRRGTLHAGEVGKLWGLGRVHVGDALGPLSAATARTSARGHGGEAREPTRGNGGEAREPTRGNGGEAREPIPRQFAPPTLEAVVVPVRADDGSTLRAALGQLAEQDPLINVRQDDARHEISVSLYGEVQQEVIEATLADEYGIAVTFRHTTPICIERPAGIGEAVEILNAEGNPFHATIGLRIDPAPFGSGVQFRLEVDTRTVPMYIYKNVEHFAEAMEQYVHAALREGLFGWQVTDCFVTMIKSNYSSADGPPSTRGPLSTAADFRKLTPMVLMRALERAGTVVCEPVARASLEIPAGSLGAVSATLSRLGAAVEGQGQRQELATIDAVLRVARLRDLRRELPGLTGGEGVVESAFIGYESVRGAPPTRRRTTANPLNRDEYLTYLSRQGPLS